MNVEALKTFATSKFARQVLVTQKHSPKILFVAGVIGAVGATVMACRATLKVSEVLDDHESQIREIDNTSTTEDYNKKAHKVQLSTAFEVAKLYAPSAGLLIVSIGALTGSHFVLTRRNAGVMAAYAGLQKAYDEYRKRVRDEYGPEVDAKFGVGASNFFVEEKTADGKTKTKDETQLDGRFGGSPYAVVFDENSKYFSREPGRNSMTIMMKQNWANDKLKAHGHLFLNEVHDFLGLPRTKAGQVVGWVHRRDNEEKTGDNYVSFGVFDGENEFVEAFIDGAERYAVLDFNVDGVILDLI